MIGSYLVGLASGLFVSAVVGWIVWPVYVHRCRLPGETWDEARQREMDRLDILAEREEIPDTVRSLSDKW
jgi:hypothetical protein